MEVKSIEKKKLKLLDKIRAARFSDSQKLLEQLQKSKKLKYGALK